MNLHLKGSFKSEKRELWKELFGACDRLTLFYLEESQGLGLIICHFFPELGASIMKLNCVNV